MEKQAGMCSYQCKILRNMIFRQQTYNYILGELKGKNWIDEGERKLLVERYISLWGGKPRKMMSGKKRKNNEKAIDSYLLVGDFCPVKCVCFLANLFQSFEDIIKMFFCMISTQTEPNTCFQ